MAGCAEKRSQLRKWECMVSSLACTRTILQPRRTSSSLLLPRATWYAGSMQPTGPNPFGKPRGGAPQSAGLSPANPYVSPQEYSGPPCVQATMRRTGGVTAICVVAIILGALGFLGSVASMIGMLAGEQIGSIMQGVQAPGMPSQVRQVQQQMNQQMTALTRRWGPVLAPLNIFHLVVCVLLVAGAIGGLREAATGYKLLIWGLWGSLGYLVLNVPTTLMFTIEYWRIVQQFMPELMRAAERQGGGPTAGFEEMMQTTATIGIVLGMAWTVIWSLVQGGFYLFSMLSIKKRMREAEYPGATTTA